MFTAPVNMACEHGRVQNDIRVGHVNTVTLGKTVKHLCKLTDSCIIRWN